MRGKPRDLLEMPADLARWWALMAERYKDVGLEESEEIATSQLLAATKELRTALRRVCTGVAHGAQTEAVDQAMINDVLGSGRLALTTASTGELRQTYVLEPSSSRILFEVAHSALRLLTEYDPARLHLCRNERCVLLFYDTTKSGTRQWCSLDCFNRTRSSENYRRRKAAAQEHK